MRFADIMRRERDRLNGEREEIVNRQKDLENKLTEVDRELAAIDAYEAAKTGKAARLSRQSRAPGKSGAPITQLSVDTGAGPRTGTRREAIFIERQFPVGRLSAEAYKERKANLGQTLTALGSYLLRRCRATVAYLDLPGLIKSR
jgi:Protein of unknown function (DUF1156)